MGAGLQDQTEVVIISRSDVRLSEISQIEIVTSPYHRVLLCDHITFPSAEDEMARNDHSGYPLKWFKDQNTVRQFHECVVCLEVLKDTVQVRGCGHQFCALCIDDVLK